MKITEIKEIESKVYRPHNNECCYTANPNHIKKTFKGIKVGDIIKFGESNYKVMSGILKTKNEQLSNEEIKKIEVIKKEAKTTRMVRIKRV